MNDAPKCLLDRAACAIDRGEYDLAERLLGEADALALAAAGGRRWLVDLAGHDLLRSRLAGCRRAYERERRVVEAFLGEPPG